MNEPISLARRSLLTKALTASAAVAAAPSAGAQVSGPDGQRDLGDVLSCATIAAARSARIAADRTLLRLVGYHAPGDGGGALYRRVAGAPAHASGSVFFVEATDPQSGIVRAIKCQIRSTSLSKSREKR